MVSLINMMVGYYKTSDDDDMVRCYLNVNIWTPFSAHASACRDDKNDEKQFNCNTEQ